MYKLGINFDEISDELDVALRTMREHGVRYGELRTVGGKNFVFWTDDEIEDFKAKLDASGIQLIAAATPLFKWYDNADDPDVEHDSFGFNPRLSGVEKRQTIERAIVIASRLAIPRLRIFSGLGTADNAGATFARSELLAYALGLADAHNIDLYLENEPVCKVHDKQAVTELFAANDSPRLKFWLDIANLIEIGEEIDTEFVARMAPRLGYLHVKDYVLEDGKRLYVPAGQGVVQYPRIIKAIFDQKPDDIAITIETHARQDKAGASIAAIAGTRQILKGVGVDYE